MSKRRKNNLPRTPLQMIDYLRKAYTQSRAVSADRTPDKVLLVHLANAYDLLPTGDPDAAWRAFRLRTQAFEHDVVHFLRHRPSGLVLTVKQYSIEGCRRDLTVSHRYREYLPNNGRDVFVVYPGTLSRFNGDNRSVVAGEALGTAAGLINAPSPISAYYVVPQAEVDLVTIRKHHEVVESGPVTARPNVQT